METLARQGFPNFKVIDKDRVDTHNVNTQIYGLRDVGALKVDALKNRMFQNVGVEIEAVNKELNAGNAKTLLKGASLVVDVFDNSASRKLVQDECRAKKIPCIHAGLFADYGEVIWDDTYRVPKDSDQDVCDYPLARNLVMFVTHILAEEILDFSFAKKPRIGRWSFTLKDLAARTLN